MRTKYTAFRCPEDLLELAKAKARQNRRSLSNYLITLIERDVAGLEEEGRSEAPEKAGSLEGSDGANGKNGKKD